MKLVMAKEGYRKVGDKYLLARKCTSCGKWLVVSTVNFHRHKNKRYGLVSQCKKCKNKHTKQWRLENKDKVFEYNKRYHEANKEKEREYQKQYREENKEKIAKRNKKWYENNKDKKVEYNKQWYEANRDKVLEQRKQYYQSPQGQVVAFNKRQRRRTKEEAQGTGITKEQWLEMMSFFNWRCAYSGEYLGGNDNSFNRTIDHIVPLNSGGNNTIWNCVPMTRSLNCSKHANNMEEWYREQSFYSEARLAKIYKWQEYAYNKWGKDSEYFNSGNIQIKLI